MCVAFVTSRRAVAAVAVQSRRRMLVRVVLLAVVVAALAAAAPALAADFWVAPAGSDRSLGTQAAPFATLARARLATRTTRGPDTVTLRGGLYRLTAPLVLEAGDSNVTWQAAPDETPVLSGGSPVTGWRDVGDGRWQATLHSDTRQLYVDGIRADHAAGAPPALVRTSTGYVAADGAALAFAHPSDLEFVYDVKWREYRGRVDSIDGNAITMQQPFFANGQLDGWAAIDLPTRIENAPELLDKPGEFYVDNTNAAITYIPRPGQDMRTAGATVPRLETLVDGSGTLARPLHDVTFRGITFADTTWLGANSPDGVVDVQANMLQVGRHAQFAGTDDKLAKMPAALRLRAAQNVRIEDDRFLRLGAAAIDLSYGSRDDTIVGCEITDTSGNGIQLGDVGDHHPRDPREPVQRITVADNWIHDVGVEYGGAVGIWGGYLVGTQIVHNEISGTPYSGISLGWGWGNRDDPPTPARDNLIEGNYVHDVLTVLDDGGGIYLLGAQPGTVIRRNVVVNPIGWGGALYLDDGSGGETLEENVAWDTHRWPYMFKGTDVVVRNNWWDYDMDWGYYFFKGTASGNTVIDRLADAGPDVVRTAGLEQPYRERFLGA
jgi:hypothetical protein